MLPPEAEVSVIPFVAPSALLGIAWILSQGVQVTPCAPHDVAFPLAVVATGHRGDEIPAPTQQRINFRQSPRYAFKVMQRLRRVLRLGIAVVENQFAAGLNKAFHQFKGLCYAIGGSGVQKIRGAVDEIKLVTASVFFHIAIL